MSTDAQVLHDVIEAFGRIPELTSLRLYVDATGGIVTIRGRVPSEVERQRAELAVRRIAGLRALVFEVSVASKPTVQLISTHRDG